ncbi:MAG: carbon starvation protein A, partial [Selenomonadaceae bacterium]|nr:carbon starvation protein A [Selenomonadaceae bacterium]
FLIAIPMFLIAVGLRFIDFNILWRYFAWTNQTLAMIVLWTGAVYMYRKFKGSKAYLIAAIPATFMSVVTTTYILQAKEGLQLSTSISYPAGFVFAAIFLFLFLRVTVLKKES